MGKTNYSIRAAMCYETVIRAAFGLTGRSNRHGANADIYRHAIMLNSPNVFDNGVRLGIVIGHMNAALQEAKMIKSDNEAFVEKIDECISLLGSYDLEDVNKAIVEASEAFVSIGWRAK